MTRGLENDIRNFFFYNIINHKHILTKYYNHQGHTYCYLGGYKNNAWTKSTETNYQNKNTKGGKEGKKKDNKVIMKNNNNNKKN